MIESICEIKKTKIICTIGPVSNNPDTIKRLIKSGMNIARLNFSHGDIETHKTTINLLRSVSKELDKNISILQDLPGPKIRIGKIDNEKFDLKSGDKIWLVKDDIVGNNEKISCSHSEVIDSLKTNDIVYINDGRIKLIVDQKKEDALLLKALNSGTIRSHKGLNIPSQNLDIDAITDADIKYIKFGIEMDIDFIAASFIRKKEDIQKVKGLIQKSGKNIKVIAKIENPAALKNIDEILQESHGIMVARGDLGIENPIEEVALNQKYLVNKARQLSKPSIVATQMLRSMIDDPFPTRAEIADITNAILDGADAIMLSEETAIGKYPVDACQRMKHVALTVEKNLDALMPFKELKKREVYPELALSYAAQEISENLDIKAFVVLTKSGKTAQLISARKVNKPILAFTTDHKVVKHLNLSWGVIPFYLEEIHNNAVLTDRVLQFIKNNELLPKGSLILLTCGTPNSLDISTNLLEMQSI